VAIALNCSVAPIEMLAVPGDAAMAVNAFVGLPAPNEEEPPHPTLAASSARERQESKTRMDL
jgi:hypothetical protein